MKEHAALKENENCEVTHASFRITGDSIHPDDVSKYLGLKAAYGHAKGTKFKTRSGEHVRERGVWVLNTEGHVKSTSLEKHLVFLLDQLGPHSERIKDYIDDPACYVDFLCPWTSASGHGGPVLSSGCFERMARLCNEISFDYYGPYDD